MLRTLISILVLVSSTGCSASTPTVAAADSGQPTPAASATPAASPTPAVAPGSYREASIADLEEVLATAQLLDVRSSAEFEGGHVPGARLLPTAELPTRLDELEEWRSEEIWLICQSGGRSARAGKLLKSKGFNVVNVRGGTGAWIASGRKVE